MNMKELDRITVIRQIEEGHITPSDGASALGISERHLRRLRHRFRTRGAGDLAHRLRGRPSNRRTPKASRRKTLDLSRGLRGGKVTMAVKTDGKLMILFRVKKLK